MASENENEKRETVDDVLAEMYKKSKKVRTVTRPDGYGGYEEITLEGNPYLKNLADRIGAAAKREKAQSGNAAAMREALVKIHGIAKTFMDATRMRHVTDSARIDVADIEALAKAALAAPLRQCDVGTAEEQAQRFRNLCNKYYDDENPCNKECQLASFPIIHGFPRCQAYWTQMPYEAEEGGAK